MLAGQAFARFLEIASAAGIEFHAAKSDFQQFADIRLVIDDQCFLARGHGPALDS